MKLLLLCVLGVFLNSTTPEDSIKYLDTYKKDLERISEKLHLADSVIGKRSFFIRLIYGFTLADPIYFVGFQENEYFRIIIGDLDSSENKSNYEIQELIPIDDAGVKSIFSGKKWKNQFEKEASWPVTFGYFVLFNSNGVKDVEFDAYSYVYNRFKIFAKKPKKKGMSLIGWLYVKYLFEVNERNSSNETIIHHTDSQWKQ